MAGQARRAGILRVGFARARLAISTGRGGGIEDELPFHALASGLGGGLTIGIDSSSTSGATIKPAPSLSISRRLAAWAYFDDARALAIDRNLSTEAGMALARSWRAE